MDSHVKTVLWQQFGASIDMLENAITACPENLWGDRSQQPEFWYLVYHTLFFLDLYLSDSEEGFAPPEPFTLSELDPAGVLPERIYSKEEMLSYLEHSRKKCQVKIEVLTDEKARQNCTFGWLESSILEMLLYNMRHIQHHAAQLNLILRQQTDSAPNWVAKARRG